MTPATILIVEDEPLVARFLESKLRSFGYSVSGIASTGEQAISLSQTTPSHLILMDIMLDGDMTGLDAARIIRSQSDIPIVFLTAYCDDDTLKKAIGTSPHGYLIKPIQDRELYCTVEISLHKHQKDKELRLKNDQLVKANQELKLIDKLKSEFTAMVSHELITPITIVKSSLHMLLDGVFGDLQAKQTEILEASLSNTNQLNTLVSNILDLAKIDAGNMTLDLTFSPIQTTLADVTNSLKAAAKQQNIRLTFQATNQLPLVYCDGQKIRQVLTNLIDNALKFTPSGGSICVTVSSRHNIPAHITEMVVSVQDTGVGIDKNKMPTIFERFSQGDSSDTRRHSGTGLGLAICRGIIQAHSGEIWVNSTPKKGSTFMFTLPVCNEPKDARILIIEDDRQVCEMIKICLKNEYDTVEIFTAHQGYEALHIAKLSKPNLIISDIFLPQLSGLDIYDRLADIPDLQNTQFIFFSGLLDSHLSKELNKRHISHILSKPLDVSSLVSATRQLLPSHLLTKKPT